MGNKRRRFQQLCALVLVMVFIFNLCVPKWTNGKVYAESGSDFDLTSLSGMRIWYDASKISESDGTKLHTLINQVENGEAWDAIQDNTNYQPVFIKESNINGKPAIRMGADSFLQVGGSNGFDLTDMTIVAVLRPHDFTPEKSQIFSRKKEGSGDHNWYFNVENHNQVNFGWKTQGQFNWNANPPVALTEETNYVLVARKDGADGTVFVNDTRETFTGGAIPEYNNSPMYLGAPAGNGDRESTLNADISEFMVFDRALSEEETAGLQSYLNQKYSQEDIPSDFVPTALPGIKTWYDAADLELEDGAALERWENKANPGTFDAVQPNAASRPVFKQESKVGQKPAVQLSKNTYLDVGNAFHLDDMSIFAVIHPDSLEGNVDDNQVFSKLALSDPWEHNWYFNIKDSAFNFGWKDAGTWRDYTGDNARMAADQDYILTGVKNQHYGILYMNGKELGVLNGDISNPNALHNNGSIYIGGAGTGRSMSGAICEIIVYDRGLSAQETAQVHTYLSEKWDLPLEETGEQLEGAITIDGEPLRAFSADTMAYKHVLAPQTTTIPVVAADFSMAGATAEVTQADTLPGTARIVISKGGQSKEYTIEFRVLDKEVSDLKMPDVEDIELLDGFWKEQIDRYRTTTINHVLDNMERTGTLRNFQNVVSGGGTVGSTDPWNDGLLYEVIRSAGDFLRVYPDAALEARIDGFIDIICSAQDNNGYLSTWAMIERPGQYFDATGNARWYHDSYNFGCMTEAAVHYYKATGKTKLLETATRFAQFLVENYGYGNKADNTKKINMVPSHQGPEEMLLKLYQLYCEEPELKAAIEESVLFEIDEDAYADLVKFWIENRGNHNGRVNGASYSVYAQDHARYFDQSRGAGHAVRANLFYTGMTAAGLEFKDYTYLASADSLWKNITEKQMYITGGVGAIGNDEAYGEDYELPNDGYCETCAQVAMGFFSEYLNLAFAETKYADTMEQLMYNGILGCIGLDGKSYYYQQPLSSKENSRWEWINHTPCCPPMFLKFFSELPSYIYAYDDNDVYVNQFISSKAVLPNGVTIEQQTDMPWEGSVRVSVKNSTTLHLRLPEWSDKDRIEIKVNNQSAGYIEEKGYAVINVNANDTVEMSVPLEAERQYSDENVVTNRGKVALSYGPLIYGIESTDNSNIPYFSRGDGNIGLPAAAELETQFEETLLGGIQTISFPAEYYDAAGVLQTIQAKAIPFYARSNRGKSSVFVWIDEDVKPFGGNAKRWLASAVNTGNYGNSAAAAFDGNTGTCWSAGGPQTPQALVVDLGSVKEVARTKITFTSAQAWKYVVLYSSDGKEWSEFKDNSGNSENRQVFEDSDGIQARYMAFKFVESAGVGYISVQEIEVMPPGSDTNLALNKLCAATSSSNNGTSVFAMLDGDETTRYCPPNGNMPQSVTFDMGDIAQITGMRILFEKDSNWNYEIEISNDGKEWNTYHSETTAIIDRKIDKEDNGRYVRFTILSTTDGVWGSVWELEVETAETVKDIFDCLPGMSDTETFGVTLLPSEHGTLEADKNEVEKGGTVIFTMQADPGYELDSFLVNGIRYLPDEDGKYIFTEVQENLTASAIFKKTIDPPGPGEIPVTGVTLSLTGTQKVEAGKTLKLKAKVLPENADNKTVQWSSSNSSVATVDATGLVRAKKAGITVINVKTMDQGKTAKCTVKVLAPVTKVKFPQTSIRLTKGKKVKIPAVAYTKDQSKAKVTYKSSNKNVAAVTSGGKITAVKKGNAKITATAENGKKHTLKVTIVEKKKAVKTKKVSILNAPKTLKSGKTKQLRAKIAPVKAANAVVKWKSSNSAIIKIDAAGKITAKKKGTAKITLSAGGKKAVVRIKVL